MGTADTTGIFISYRRDDSAGHTGRLFDALTARFGTARVFMDVDSIELGADFLTALIGAIEQSRVVLVVVGPRWTDARDPVGGRRLDDPRDVVRQELEIAFERSMRVVPVLVGGAAMPSAADLPEALSALARCNAFELSDRLWNESARVLVDALEEFVDAHQRATPTNIPAQLTTFVGRDDMVMTLRDTLASQRLVTLIGPGGVGKTRLALELAERVAPDFTSGVWIVDLTPLRDAAFIGDTVATTLGVSQLAGVDPIDRMIRHIGDRRMLLVVDNCEHLLTGAADVVRRLVRGCAELHVIATSREPLGISGEASHVITPLAVPPTVVSVDTLQANDAAMLFVARARLARPDFVLDESNAPAVAEICTRLDGLPLAIELAASRLRSLSPSQIAERLNDAFRLLRAGTQHDQEHHRTLRATIEWSFELLSEAEQSVLARLSVFAGGCSLGAAEQVCGTERVDVLDVLDILAALVDKSMVVATDEPDGDVRYTLLETIRMYAAEQLAADGEQAHTSAAHLAWALDLAGDGLPPASADQLRWLDRLDREHDNVRSALAWAFEHAPESGAQLTASLHRFWDIRGHFDEASRWLPTALRIDSHPSRTLAELLRGAANIAHSTGQLLDALELNQRSAEVARACGDRTALCSALNNMGVIRVTIGDFDLARALLQEMADAAQGLANEAEYIDSAATMLADAAWQQSRFDEAASLLESSRRSGQQGSFYSAFPDYPAALLAARRGEVDTARALLTGARDGIQHLGEPTWTVDMLAELAAIAIAQSHFDEARALLDQGLALADELPLPAPKASLLHTAAALERATGRHERASELARQALEIRQRLGLKLRVAETLELVAGLRLDLGEPSAAAALLGAAEAVRARLDAPISPGQRAEYDSDIARTRRELGEQFAAAWRRGQDLDIEQAVDLALTRQGPDP